MAVHRRQLPLAYRCEGFVPAPGSTGDGGFCERCQRQVHDVSAMREPELRRLLAAHAGGTICLAFRTDARGRVRLRPEPRSAPWAVGALALLLAACAGHAAELEIPGTACRDEDGYAVSCPEWSDPSMLSVPEATEAIAAREAEDPPVQPVEPVSEDDPAEPSLAPPDPLSPSAAASDDAAPGTTVDMEAFRSIELEGNITRGVVAVTVVTTEWVEPGFVPTAELVEQARVRRAERLAARQRWRAARRRAAASR